MLTMKIDLEYEPHHLNILKRCNVSITTKWHVGDDPKAMFEMRDKILESLNK